jgi:hypothetical protein
MKKISVLIITILFACIFTMTMHAQEPFDVPCIDYPKFTTIDFTNNFIEVESNTNNSISNNIRSFSQQSLGLSATGGTLIPSINVNIIQYRLGLFSYLAKSDKIYKNSNDIKFREGDTIRFYLPLLLISKFNTNYDTANLATITDMTSFIGSPLTMRFMPSYTCRVGLENTFTIGHSSDFRTILYQDSLSQKLKTGFGYYGTIGLKYAGRGEVRDETGTSYEGNWSISALLYTFITSQEVQKQLFENQNKAASGIETIFKFKVAETKVTRFNIYASAQYQFNENGTENPFIFKIGIGN